MNAKAYLIIDPVARIWLFEVRILFRNLQAASLAAAVLG
jgi:hypothetical protein